MFRTLRFGDMVAGALIALLGLATLMASTRINEGAGGQLHPRTFPTILAGLTLAAGAFLIVRGSLAKTDLRTVEWPNSEGWRRWWIGCLMIGAFVALMSPLGFLITSFLFIIVMMIYYGHYHWYSAGATALGTVLVIYFLFDRLLGLPFPMGPLAFLR